MEKKLSAPMMLHSLFKTHASSPEQATFYIVKRFLFCFFKKKGAPGRAVILQHLFPFSMLDSHPGLSC